jgi:hypothetical protein
MTGEREELAKLPVELATTRPTMLWLPWLGAVPVAMGALLFFVFANLVLVFKLWWMIIPGVASWKIMSMLCGLDWHIMTLFQVYLRTSCWDTRTHAEGGAGPRTVLKRSIWRGV